MNRTRAQVEEILARAIQNGGDDSWDDFVSIPIADPELERIRRACLDVTLSPKDIFERVLREILGQMQSAT